MQPLAPPPGSLFSVSRNDFDSVGFEVICHAKEQLQQPTLELPDPGELRIAFVGKVKIEAQRAVLVDDSTIRIQAATQRLLAVAIEERHFGQLSVWIG